MIQHILFVNACMRGREESRTWLLSQAFLEACKGQRRAAWFVVLFQSSMAADKMASMCANTFSIEPADIL